MIKVHFALGTCYLFICNNLLFANNRLRWNKNESLSSVHFYLLHSFAVCTLPVLLFLLRSPLYNLESTYTIQSRNKSCFGINRKRDLTKQQKSDHVHHLYLWTRETVKVNKCYYRMEYTTHISYVEVYMKQTLYHLYSFSVSPDAWLRHTMNHYHLHSRNSML